VELTAAIGTGHHLILCVHFFPPFFVAFAATVAAPLLARIRPVARFGVAGKDLGVRPRFGG
jgi:hypothetical protein